MHFGFHVFLLFLLQSAMYSQTITQFEDPPKKKLNEDLVILEPVPIRDEEEVEQPWIWLNIIGIAALHMIAFYNFFVHSTKAHWATWVFSESKA